MKQKLLDLFGTKYGEPISLTEWMNECIKMKIYLDYHSLLKNLEYLLFSESESIPEGSPVEMGNPLFKLHYIDPVNESDEEKFLSLCDNEDDKIFLRLSAVHVDSFKEVDTEWEKLDVKLVYISQKQLIELIMMIKLIDVSLLQLEKFIEK